PHVGGEGAGARRLPQRRGRPRDDPRGHPLAQADPVRPGDRRDDGGARADPRARGEGLAGGGVGRRRDADRSEGVVDGRARVDPTGGMKRNDQRGPVEIRNVPQGRTADDEILEAIQSTGDRTQYTVVSNDLAIVKAAEKQGFTVVPCEEFAKQISKREEPPEK